MTPASLKHIPLDSAPPDSGAESETHFLRKVLARLESDLYLALVGIAGPEGGSRANLRDEDARLFGALWGNKDSIATAALQLVALHTRIVELETALAKSVPPESRSESATVESLPPPSENDFQIIARYVEKMRSVQDEQAFPAI